MIKKFLCVLIALCMVFGAFATVAYAKDEMGEINDAKKAVRNAEKTLPVYNDMTMDEFLKAVEKVLPEGSDVTVGIVKEADYRVYNATSEKAGSIFANIEFTCDVYKIKDMYTFTISQLTGQAAEDNADLEKITEDAKLAHDAFVGITLESDVTEQQIVDMAQAAVKNGSKVESAGDYVKVDSTKAKRGSVKVNLILTLNKETKTVKVYNGVRELADDAAAVEDTKDNKADTPKDDGKAAPVNFTDVKADAYYANAVAWAVEKNITAGTSATTFSPDDTCTRAQIITFLWRALGSQKMSFDNPFADVKETDYYYDAAIWAYMNGMVDTENFEANTPCTRASTVMYLWLASEEPECEYDGTFADVSNNAEYAEAVAWALENNITSGTSATTFSPDTICSRGQIVTFLNRTINK